MFAQNQKRSIQTVFRLQPIDIQRRLQSVQIVINNQNNRFWGIENQRLIQEKVQFDRKVVVESLDLSFLKMPGAMQLLLMENDIEQ